MYSYLSAAYDSINALFTSSYTISLMSTPGNTSLISKLKIVASSNVNLDKTLIRIALIKICISSSYDATFPSFK